MAKKFQSEKLKNFKIYYQKGNWEIRYLKYMKKFNSKYTLLIGDDDRLNINNFSKIFKYLNYDFSGITLSFNNYQNNDESIKYKKKYLNLNAKDINTKSNM